MWTSKEVQKGPADDESVENVFSQSFGSRSLSRRRKRGRKQQQEEDAVVSAATTATHSFFLFRLDNHSTQERERVIACVWITALVGHHPNQLASQLLQLLFPFWSIKDSRETPASHQRVNATARKRPTISFPFFSRRLPYRPLVSLQSKKHPPPSRRRPVPQDSGGKRYLVNVLHGVVEGIC